jgi:hypothetical protein
LPLTPFNLVCTNVPGPQFPLYLLGHKMLSWYPYVPIGGDMALNCAVLSYNGVTYFGFSGDSHAAPDLKRLEGFLQVSLAEILKAAGCRRPAKTAAADHKNREEAKPENKNKPEAKTESVEDKPKTEKAKLAVEGESEAAEAQQAVVLRMPEASVVPTLPRTA